MLTLLVVLLVLLALGGIPLGWHAWGPYYGGGGVGLVIVILLVVLLLGFR